MHCTRAVPGSVQGAAAIMKAADCVARHVSCLARLVGRVERVFCDELCVPRADGGVWRPRRALFPAAQQEGSRATRRGSVDRRPEPGTRSWPYDANDLGSALTLP